MSRAIADQHGRHNWRFPLRDAFVSSLQDDQLAHRPDAARTRTVPPASEWSLVPCDHKYRRLLELLFQTSEPPSKIVG